MRRMSFVYPFFAGLAGVMLASGCGGSAAVTAPDEAVVAVGASVLHGAVLAPGLSSSSAAPGVSAQSGGSGWVVSVAGTPLTCELDQDGRFVLSKVPSGSVAVKIEGPGVSAQVAVSGLVDGQVTSVEIRVSGGSAELTTAAKSTPTAETHFSGSLDQLSGTQLVVAGRSVDASKIQKVWRGARRIELSELAKGELVKVWGMLRGDAVVVAEEIQALTNGGETWVKLSGRVESVSAGFMPNPTPALYPSIVVKGTAVKTSAETKVWCTDGSAIAASEIKVGQAAEVEGWKKADGSVRAAKILIAK